MQAMKKIPVTTQLLDYFRSNGETLIMEGYCKYFDNVTVYNDGVSYAVVANTNGSAECCIYSESTSFIDGVIRSVLGKVVKFCGVSQFVTDYINSKYTFNWQTDCYLYVWNGEPILHESRCDLRAIDSSYAQQVSDGTHYRAPLDDIRECLVWHPSSAAYVDGKPVCWCLLHKEGSLGMLYTLPEYRRQGYALEVMTDITAKVIKRGDIPFAYIVQDNIASQNLAAKYNLKRAAVANYFEIDLSGAK